MFGSIIEPIDMVPEGCGRDGAVAIPGWPMPEALKLPLGDLDTSLIELCRY